MSKPDLGVLHFYQIEKGDARRITSLEFLDGETTASGYMEWIKRMPFDFLEGCPEGSVMIEPEENFELVQDPINIPSRNAEWLLREFFHCKRGRIKHSRANP